MKNSPGLYRLASSWAPLCCGPHRGCSPLLTPGGTDATALLIVDVAAAADADVNGSPVAFGSSSDMEFSKICRSVLTGAAAATRKWLGNAGIVDVDVELPLASLVILSGG